MIRDDSFSPFLRRIEVIVGPFEEHIVDNNDEASGRRFFADGTSDNLRIQFSIKKHIITTSSPSIFSIFNLSRETRNELKKKYLRILVNVGWDNVPLVRIFQGSILATRTERRGADLVTDIMSLSSFAGLSRSVIPSAYGEGMLVADIVKDLASKIEGVSVDSNRIKLQEHRMGSRGWNNFGSIKSQLNDLARIYQFDWGIENGSFWALDENQTFSGVVKLESGYGLKRAEPKLVAPTYRSAGASISSVLNPYIEPGILIDLNSLYNPDINGEYKATTVDHIGDSHSDSWDTQIESWITF